MAITKEAWEPEMEALMAISKGTTGNRPTRNITDATYKTKER
jgi:hypothetical protein